MPVEDIEKVLFSVEADDGIHVAWPQADGVIDVEAGPVVIAALTNLHDFFDTRRLLALVRNGDDLYAVADALPPRRDRQFSARAGAMEPRRHALENMMPIPGPSRC